MAPLSVGLLRTIIAALITLPLVLVWRLPLPRRFGRMAQLATAIGGSLIAFPLLFSLGVGRTSASHAGLILAALPLPTGLFGMLAERRLPPWTWWIGAGIALTGEVLLIGFDTGAAARSATLTGDLLVAVGALGAAAGHVAGARLSITFGTWPTALWGISLAGLILLPVLSWQTDPQSLAAAGTEAWLAIGFLAGGSTLLAFAAWYWALARGGVTRMGAVQFLQPVVTLALAAVLLDEPLTWRLVLAAAVILAGVALTQQRWQTRH